MEGQIWCLSSRHGHEEHQRTVEMCFRNMTVELDGPEEILPPGVTEMIELNVSRCFQMGTIWLVKGILSRHLRLDFRRVIRAKNATYGRTTYVKSEFVLVLKERTNRALQHFLHIECKWKTPPGSVQQAQSFFQEAFKEELCIDED